MSENIFLQISALLALTVSIAFVMRMLRQPLLIAYIIAGLIAGPMALNMLDHDGQSFQMFADFGIVLLLFVIGLSMNVSHIKKIGRISLIAGLSQFFFTAILGFGILKLFNGTSNLSALYLAIAITFSSTIIIAKLLTDKKDVETVYGRYTIGLMVVQDIIAVILLMVITSVTSGGSLGRETFELFVKSILLFGFASFLARFVAPRILERVASSGEFLFLFTVTWCFGVASILHALGFSLEIGALIAGMTLGSSPYQPEIASRIKPLRDFFIVIFFLILGSSLSLAHLSTIWAPGLVLSLFILIGNPFILYITFRLLRFTRRNSFLAGVTAAQVSEFGFVLLIVGKNMGHIQGTEIEIFTIVALATILLSSYLITYNEQIYRALRPLFEGFFGRDRRRQSIDKRETYAVWVVGYHRLGWKICDRLLQKGVGLAVIDFNPDAIEKARARGIPAYFGDVADVEFLEELPLGQSDLIISTIPEPDDQKTLLLHIQGKKRRPMVIATLQHSRHLDELYRAGASYVILPHLLGGQWISDVLTGKQWTPALFRRLQKEQHKEMTAHGKGLFS